MNIEGVLVVGSVALVMWWQHLDVDRLKWSMFRCQSDIKDLRQRLDEIED